MVTVVNAHLREGKDGSKEWVSLEIQGDVEIIQSNNTGRFYVTARKCFMQCTFDFETAKKLIGRQMPGNIKKVESDPYDYTVPESGEVVQLSHTYSYIPEGGLPEKEVPFEMIMSKNSERNLN